MDDTHEEKAKLLESIRLQDAALSATGDSTLVDMDDTEEEEAKLLESIRQQDAALSATGDSSLVDMDDTEEEEAKLLESIRLQDAALSATADTALVDMDDTEEEKVKLLESIRLQDAALSVTADSALVTLESDSDREEESSTVENDQPKGSHSSYNDITKEVPIGGEVNSLSPGPSQLSWADALSANIEYDGVLAQLEVDIKKKLFNVSKELNHVQSEIESLSTEGKTINMKSHWLYVFGAPYFKDSSLYPCPPNQDYHLKKINDEICWSELPPFCQWIPESKKLLSSGVRKLSLKKCETDARLKLAAMRKELQALKESSDDLRAEVLAAEIESFDVKAVAESMVDAEIENGEHDWLQISAKYLEGKQSPENCRTFWELYMHPCINKEPFTEDEENQLVRLVDEFRQQDWDKIAEELGTNRSGYQCFIVYQNKLNAALRRHSWQPDEDQKLIQLVQKYRMGNFVPWGKVTYHMDGRTKGQVFNRWTYSLNPAIKKGRFTSEEDIMILVGVQMWGEDFQRIATFIKDRTTAQVRSRYRNYLSRSEYGVPWTLEDDERLLDLEKRHSRSWAKIAKYFPGKNRTQVRHRFGTLSKWRLNNPDAPMTDAPSRCYNPQSYKDFHKRWEKAKSILSCETVDEMVQVKKALVKNLVRHKHKETRKKKPSLIEHELINYFRCSYEIPGGHKKSQLRSGEAKNYAAELKILLQILKANLKLPCLEDLEVDPDLSIPEKAILEAYVTEANKNSPTDSLTAISPDAGGNEEFPNLPLFCDVEQFASFVDHSESTRDIDYVSPRDVESVYISLPVMNFTQDEIVIDRIRNPSSFVAPQETTIMLNNVGFPSSSKYIENYICPPNLTTLVGLRTYLLNRRNLLNWSNENPNRVASSMATNLQLEEAKRKFDERALFLFLWPALMSRHGPELKPIFLEDAKKKVKSRKPSQNQLDNEINKGEKSCPIATSVKKVAETESSISEHCEDGANEPYVSPGAPSEAGSNLGPPQKKRRKTMAPERPDSDPGDPDDVI